MSFIMGKAGAKKKNLKELLKRLKENFRFFASHSKTLQTHSKYLYKMCATVDWSLHTS